MPSADTSLTHVDRRGISIDEAVAFYENVYSSRDLHVGRTAADGFTWRFRAVGDAQLSIGTSAVAATRWGTIGQNGTYVVAWATGPGIALDSASRTPIHMLPGVPIMYPSGRDFEFEALPTTQHMIRFDAAFLEAVAAARHATIPAPLRFQTVANPAVMDRLRAVIAAVAPELLRADISRSRRATLNMLLAEVVVDAYDVTPTSDFALYEGPATMRFAQEWMVANAHRPITITDVSRASGIAARSVQAAFLRHAGTTPMAFLRSVRLHRARVQLTAADPSAVTVAEIARAWGFAHLGRFANYYAAAFGELPSDTLRRSTHDQPS